MPLRCCINLEFERDQAIEPERLLALELLKVVETVDVEVWDLWCTVV